MNIDSFDMKALGNEGAWIDIVGPDGRATDLKVKVRGVHSDAVRRAAEEHQRRVSAAVKAAGGKDVDFDALDKVRDQEMAIATTIDWQNFERDGHALQATPENVKAVMTHGGFAWLAAQVYAASQQAGSFLKP